MDLSPELFGEDDDVFMSARILVRSRLAEVPELKVLDEPKACPRDHYSFGRLIVAGGVEGRVENTLESRDQALVITAVLGQAEGFKDGGGGAKAHFAVLLRKDHAWRGELALGWDVMDKAAVHAPVWQNGTMRICAAQLRPVAGDIASNLAKHRKLIDLAVAHGADLVYFPELSLTGYEPRLAKSLATNEGDSRLDALQECSDAHNLLVGIGLPISFESSVRIGMVWFSPTAPRRTYAKQLLHADELLFFVRGESQLMLKSAAHSLAPAICYESLIANHSEHAAKLGADIYLASVAKSTGGLAKAMSHYPNVARKHNMYIVMSNCVGPSDDFVSVGHSAVWDRNGQMLARMDSDSEGIVLLDTATGKADTHRAWIEPSADIVSGTGNESRAIR